MGKARLIFCFTNSKPCYSSILPAQSIFFTNDLLKHINNCRLVVNLLTTILNINLITMMKKIILSVCVSIFAFTGFTYAQTSSTPASQPAKTVVKSAYDNVVKFKQEDLNFGATKVNKPVTVDYFFTNISQKPLLVENASASCGCTQPKWTMEPVLPGQQGKITVTFNAPAVGMQNKTIWVRFKGFNEDVVLHLLGKVE